MSLPVVNKAIAGTSARSFTETGDFANLISLVVENDWVVIEFGHNDGTAGAVDNGRQDAVGDAYNLTSVVTTSKYVLWLCQQMSIRLTYFCNTAELKSLYIPLTII